MWRPNILTDHSFKCYAITMSDNVCGNTLLTYSPCTLIRHWHQFTRYTQRVRRLYRITHPQCDSWTRGWCSAVWRCKAGTGRSISSCDWIQSAHHFIRSSEQLVNVGKMRWHDVRLMISALSAGGGRGKDPMLVFAVVACRRTRGWLVLPRSGGRGVWWRGTCRASVLLLVDFEFTSVQNLNKKHLSNFTPMGKLILVLMEKCLYWGCELFKRH